MVRQVLSVGFEACLIKSTLELQILKNGKPFSDPNSLILAVLDTEGEERPSTHMITNLETEDATVPTSFDELTSCNSDLKESLEGAMINPVEEVEHRRPESPRPRIRKEICDSEGTTSGNTVRRGTRLRQQEQRR